MFKNLNTSTQTARDPRRRRFRTISTALTIVVIVGIILLNVIVSVLADRYPLSFDMSSDKVFSLSDDAKKVAHSVEKDVEIVIFADAEEHYLALSEQIYTYYLYYQGIEVNLSNQFERLGREVNTVLAQLQTQSNGKISYTTIIPDQEPEKYAKYTKYNMGENNVLLISGERYRKTSLDNMFEIASQTAISSRVEKILLSNISNLQQGKENIVQVLTGHGEDQDTISGLQNIYDLNGYSFEELIITGSAEFNDKAETLLIAAPSKDYSANEIERIRTWLKNDNRRNRHLMVYINPTADCPNLYEMLKTDFHIEVTDQLIYESDPDRYLNDGQQYNFGLIYADVPETKYSTNSNGTRAVIMPNTRRLICDLPSENDNQGIAELGIPLTTHPDTAWVSSIGSDGGKIALKADQFPLTSSVAYVYETFDDNTQQAATTTVTVCGSSAMAYDLLTQDSGTGNEEWLLDLLHTMTGYKADISISNKVISKDSVEFTSGTQIMLGIWVFTVGIPVVVLIICMIVFLRRRSL